MKFVKLLAVLAVLSLLVVPVISAHGEKRCTAMSEMSDTPEGCNDTRATNYCGNCSDESCYYSGYACFSQSPSSYGMEGYDPEYSYIGKGGSRSLSREYSTSSSWTDDGGLYLDPSSTGSSDIGPPYPKAVEHLPPSAKLVYTVLKSDGLLTQKDIINKTYLPGRTVRYALSRLKNENVIQERFCFRDARQTLYGLNMAVINAVQMQSTEFQKSQSSS